MAENLELRREEVAKEIAQMTGHTLEYAQLEVDMSIQRLFYWGAYADKYGGTVQVGGHFHFICLRQICQATSHSYAQYMESVWTMSLCDEANDL